MTMFYSLINDLQDSATSGSTKRQLRALTRITDLFLAGSGHYSKRQIELFDEVFKTLVEVIELKTRVELARRFATEPNAPSSLVLALARDENVDVAGLVLSQSAALGEPDLVASARTQSQGHLYALAQRRSISEAVTDILIQRGERRVIHAVAGNHGASISDSGFRELVLRSGDDTALALRVGARRDIPRHHFLKLLEVASASVQSKLIEANRQLADAVRDAVTDVVDGINEKARGESHDHARARNRVKRLQDWKDLKEVDVHAAARAHNFEQTVMTLSALAGCPVEMTERAVLGDNPGAVQIIAKVAGCSWTTVKALLLMSVADRRMSKSDLDRARENFERLEWRTARRVLEFYEARRLACHDLARPRAAGASTKLAVAG